MDTAAAELLTVSDLVRLSRPLCGTTFLASSTSSRPSAPSEPQGVSPFGNPSTTTNILIPMNRPVFLVGIVSLPVFDVDEHPSTPHKCPSSNSSCLRFSDGTSTVCCDVLNFGVRMLLEKVLVLAFNFTPFKQGGGFLEIVKWSFRVFLSGQLHPCSTTVPFPLRLHNASAYEDSGAKARYNIIGAIESVGPVFTAPCSMTNESNRKNLRGFLVEFIICNCQLCKSKIPVDKLVKTADSHSYSKSVFVYFCGSCSPWHPAITKLIGSSVVLSGLKKKLMFIGRGESQLIFVITEVSLLHVLRMPWKQSVHAKTRIRGRGECGHYNGVVRAVYLQGTVVELDKEVWLLLTDQQSVLPHSIRVGAIIAVKNAHFVRANFSGNQVLIVGCCFRSSILVESFSPLETGCHIVSQMPSLLRNLIAPLAFSARLWMLLAFSSFCRKFDGILQEEEILGSKKTEGLLQMYATSCLPSWAFRSRHGVFSEMCKHASASCGYSSEPHDVELKLMVPLSIFMLYCENMLSRAVFRQGKTYPESCIHHGGNCSQTVRRIIPSQEIGINLSGTLKISPASGRLQFFDATGSIDVLIPDLPSTWKPNSIYEVSEYNLIIEGIPQKAQGHSKEHIDEPFSCKMIFDWSSLRREINVGIVIYFHFRNATCRELSFNSSDVPKEDHEDLNGEFLMLQVLHKFPVSQKFPGDLAISERSSAIVEAIVLPWGLFLARNDSGQHFSEVVGNLSDNCSQISIKRQKTDRSSQSPGSLDDLNSMASDRSNISISTQDNINSDLIDMNSHKIPCLACARNSNKMVLVGSGILYSIKSTVKTDISYKPSILKTFMEFKSFDLFQYQGLQIGGFYIVKHERNGSSCTFPDSDSANGLKILITSKTKFWRLYMFPRETLFYNGVTCNAAFSNLLFRTYEVFVGEVIRNLVKAPASYSLVTTDIYLQVCRDLWGPLELDLKKIRRHFTNVASTIEEDNLFCNETGVSLSSSFNECGFSSPFPVGNLTCIRGEIIGVHNLKSLGSLDDDKWPRNCNGDVTSVSIYIVMGHHTVEVFGSLRKYAWPIGFGEGVYATFYRILKHSMQNRFMLTPISFIEIDSVRMVNDASLSLHADVCSASNIFVASDATSLVLISQLVLSSCSSFIHLRCRVVDVCMLILERSDTSKPILKSMGPPQFDIPIAAFVLEDGSSSCVCWTNGDLASTLLRLSDEFPNTAVGRTCESSGCYYLDRILRRHDRITMKNYSSLSDSCEDSFSVSSGNILSNSDENLLKSIIFNACFGLEWAIVGTVMDLDAVRELQGHYLQADMELDSFQHLWARELHGIDSLEEARSLVKQLRTNR
ncbi:hypothetical protein SAY86_003229 [Trapa natans]|uniref:CST complex subunit CTC1 n=1 Tax=Trapa natans TaxID=22666 RepID=A0AAN7MDU7_TRANT|nr:hypothetical protein SAY86_003229 [Trapa natans]